MVWSAPSAVNIAASHAKTAAGETAAAMGAAMGGSAPSAGKTAASIAIPAAGETSASAAGSPAVPRQIHRPYGELQHMEVQEFGIDIIVRNSPQGTQSWMRQKRPCRGADCAGVTRGAQLRTSGLGMRLKTIMLSNLGACDVRIEYDCKKII